MTIRDSNSEPSWSNNSRRIAFSDWITGAIGTVGMDGSEILLDTAYAWGCWFRWGFPGELMVVPVDDHGVPPGDAYSLTDASDYTFQPSFSSDGKTIVFSGHPEWDSDYGLFTVSELGRPITTFRGAANINGHDTAFSTNDWYVVCVSGAGVGNR